jgi:hypothetical protein
MDLSAQIIILHIGDQDIGFFLPIINTEIDDVFTIKYGRHHLYFKVDIDVYNKIKKYIKENAATTSDYDREKFLAITGGKWIGFFAQFKIIIEEDEEVYYISFKDESLIFFNNLINELSQEDDIVFKN